MHYKNVFKTKLNKCRIIKTIHFFASDAVIRPSSRGVESLESPIYLLLEVVVIPIRDPKSVVLVILYLLFSDLFNTTLASLEIAFCRLIDSQRIA